MIKKMGFIWRLRFTGDAQINGNELTDTITGDETIQATFSPGMNITLMTAVIIAAEQGASD